MAKLKDETKSNDYPKCTNLDLAPYRSFNIFDHFFNINYHTFLTFRTPLKFQPENKKQTIEKKNYWSSKKACVLHLSDTSSQVIGQIQNWNYLKKYMEECEDYWHILILENERVDLNSPQRPSFSQHYKTNESNSHHYWQAHTDYDYTVILYCYSSVLSSKIFSTTSVTNTSLEKN